MTHLLRPTVSPEHGIYVVAGAALLSGIAIAEGVTLTTTLAFVVAFGAIQTEHAVGLLLRRKTDRVRHALWGVTYGAITGMCALILAWRVPALLAIYAVGATALGYDLLAIGERNRKGTLNELIGFAAVCSASVVAYASVTGRVASESLGIWALDAAYFGSSVFLVKLRKPKADAFRIGLVYHIVVAAILIALIPLGALTSGWAVAFLLAPIKFAFFAWRLAWFRALKIQIVGILETAAALGFVLWIVAMTQIGV